MITIICANPAVDKIIYTDKLAVGGKSFVKRNVKSAGGKGVNVARIVSKLQEKVCLIGFKAGQNGNYIDSEIAKENVLSLLVKVDGNTRENINIIDELGETELLFPGPTVDINSIGLLKDIFEEVILRTEVLVCSGSLPKGLSDNFYNDFIIRAKANNIMTIVDAKGAVLREAVKAKPFMIKPNLQELSELTGRIIDSDEDAIEVAREIIAKGIEVVYISMGSRGNLYITAKEVLRIDGVIKDSKNSIGCGDALLAGYVAAVAKNKSIIDTLKMATACAMSNLDFDEVGFIDMEKVKNYCKYININNNKI